MTGLHETGAELVALVLRQLQQGGGVGLVEGGQGWALATVGDPQQHQAAGSDGGAAGP